MNAIQFINEMDYLAKTYFGEFGYDTCNHEQKQAVIKLLLHRLYLGKHWEFLVDIKNDIKFLNK